MLRRLIVNADDFGLTPGVSRGIIKAHQEGIVTSTSVMINQPHAEEGLELAKETAPDLGIGLHLNLTAGSPVSAPGDIPDLVDPSGAFLKHDQLIDKYLSIDLQQVKTEFKAQIDRFISLMGRPPDHLDSHHYIAAKSIGPAELLIELATEPGCPIRNETARDDILEGELARTTSHIFGEDDMPQTIESLNSTLSSGKVPAPDHFIGGFYGETATLGNLLLILLDLKEGVSELMCHPAEVDDLLRDISSFNERRGDELAALIEPSTREVIHSEFIQLINFGDLK